MKDKILQQISDKFAKTNGGITIVELSELNKTTFLETKKVLSELYKEGKIKIRESINHKLIYLK